MIFRTYTSDKYNELCGFLIELNRKSSSHINWNWARLEWMIEHPEFDKASQNSIGLWYDDHKLVGAAIYDMYFGEGFCAVLPEYQELFPTVLEYAFDALSDEDGFALAINDNSKGELEAAAKSGFIPIDQSETVMCAELDKIVPAELPEGFHFEELDPAVSAYDFQWLLWQGFDHGTDRSEFESSERIIPQVRVHLDPYLSLTAVSSTGEKAAYCCLWYSGKTDYVYLEPLCTVPSFRGMGIARALVCEALHRAGTLGAGRAYVISDMSFYEKLGFKKEQHFTFYRKNKRS